MNFLMKKILFISLVWIPVFVFSGPDYRQLISNSGSAKDFPGANVLMVFDSISVDVKESGLSYTTTHKLVKILTKTGALNWTVIKTDYDPLSAFMQIKEATIYRKSGEIIRLDTSKILDYPAPAGTILWGAREKMLEVGRLEPGDAVEIVLFFKGFTYALLTDEDERYIPPMKGHFYDIVPFWTSDAVKEKVYKITLPADKPLQYKFYNGEVQVETKISDGKMIYIFTKNNITAFKSEPNMVAVSDVAPKLLLSTSPDWQSKSRWFYQVNEDYGSFKATPEIKAKVEEILKNAKNELDSVSLLTHWAGDEIRYLGLSMGQGEGYTLHDGNTIYTDRCGVCKDKASILITLLRAAGFEAYAAMTMAGSRIDKIPADQFNHSVTVVKLKDGKFHLLDPTWVPFVRELWSSLEQQQNYLVGTKDGEDLAITPLSPPENHYYKLLFSTRLSEDGTLTGALTLEAEGQSDASFRNIMTRNFRSTWYNNFEAELLRDYPQMKILSMNFTDGYDYSKPFHLFVKFEIPGYATVAGDEILFTPFSVSNLFPYRNSHLRIATSPESKKFPTRDACSKSILIGENLTVPRGYVFSYQPANDTVVSPVATFESSLVTNGNTLYINEIVNLFKRIYEADEWPGLRKVVAAQKKLAKEKVIIRKTKSVIPSTR